MFILIIGAGPTGLTAAVELARCGIIARVVDHKPAHSTLSRAVGINPHTLHLLEASDVTPRLVARGIKIRRATLYDNDQPVATLQPGLLPRPYDFLLSLPQDETEEILQARFSELGGNVEYNTQVSTLILQDGKAVVMLEHEGKREEVTADRVIAADGAHSIVRNALGIEFKGYDRPEPWGIADVNVTNVPYASDQAYLFLHGGQAFGFMIGIGTDRFRVVAGQSDAIAAIPDLAPHVTATRAKNEFKIGVRQAVTYQKGCVFLAGDAAHTHTPAGGLGMNTGIGDACELVQRIIDGTTEGYTASRHGEGARVIKISENLVRMAALRNPFLRALRRVMFRLLASLPVVQKILLRNLLARS
jgi:2-polyprenyl-6-methoxyphenol hydroxylase-like FAD-dependent oxidoreductase